MLLLTPYLISKTLTLDDYSPYFPKIIKNQPLDKHNNIVHARRHNYILTGNYCRTRKKFVSSRHETDNLDFGNGLLVSISRLFKE